MGKVIGCSYIGNNCRRFLWLKFREAFKQIITPELQKIFDDGNRLESVVIDDLKAIGENVKDRDEKTQKQFWIQDPQSNFVGGFLDGLIVRDGEEMVLEIKSANDKNFKTIKRYGMKKVKPVYHTQLNLYLGFTRHEHGLWRVINKETEEIYEEVLTFDKKKFSDDARKARAVVDAPDVLEPCRSSFNCRFCDCKDICEGRRLPEITCKTCRYYQVKNDMRFPRCLASFDGRCQREPCNCFVYTNNIIDMAGFTFEDEDVFFNHETERLEDCIMLLRDDYGNEYPVRGIDDCIALKERMESGWSPKARIGY